MTATGIPARVLLFLLCCEEGKHAEAQALLAQEEHSDTFTTQRWAEADGEGALHLAARNGNLAATTMLLQLPGADINLPCSGEHPTTPLLCAIQGNHLSIVQQLLERKADPDRALPEGITPLHLAVLNNRPLLIQELLQAGADALRPCRVCSFPPALATPLGFAALAGRPDLVRLLQEHLRSKK